MHNNLNEKIVFITGSTSGIGKAAALEMAKAGAKVILHGRNLEKILRVKEEIEKCSGNSKIDFVAGDMSSMTDVRSIANEIVSRYSCLDVLVNNAGGVMNAKREITADGLERTFALNVASVYLLTGLLFNLLRNSQEARIINIASMAHKFARPDWDDLQCEKKYSPNLAYGNAKLYVICLTEELNRRLKKHGIQNVTVNSLHPGVVATNFALESKGSVMNFFFRFFRPFLISPEKGAETTVFLASSPKVKGISGLYFAKSKPAKVKRKYINDDNCLKLWRELEKITCLSFLSDGE